MLRLLNMEPLMILYLPDGEKSLSEVKYEIKCYRYQGISYLESAIFWADFSLELKPNESYKCEIILENKIIEGISKVFCEYSIFNSTTQKWNSRVFGNRFNN